MLLLLNRNINNCFGLCVTESGQALAAEVFSFFMINNEALLLQTFFC